MSRGRRTWREKLADAEDLPRIEPISGAMIRIWGAGTVVLPAPWESEPEVPRGHRRPDRPAGGGGAHTVAEGGGEAVVRSYQRFLVEM